MVFISCGKLKNSFPFLGMVSLLGKQGRLVMESSLKVSSGGPPSLPWNAAHLGSENPNKRRDAVCVPCGTLLFWFS